MEENQILSEAINSCPNKLDLATYCQGFVDCYHKFGKEFEWHYPSKKDFPPFGEVVYIWDDEHLWRGHYRCCKKGNKKHKWWEVFGKGGIYSMQDDVEAWTPLSTIKPPKVK